MKRGLTDKQLKRGLMIMNNIQGYVTKDWSKIALYSKLDKQNSTCTTQLSLANAKEELEYDRKWLAEMQRNYK